MFPLDRKKAVTIILGPRHEDAPQDGEDPREGLHKAAEALIEAVHRKDTAAVADALESAFVLLDEDDGEEEDGSPDGEHY